MIKPMESTSSKSRKLPRRHAFTLVEMLVVVSIMIIMITAGANLFRNANGLSGVRGAAAAASGFFSMARNEAIMRRSPCRVIVDTAYVANRSDLADHYLRRMTVAYLDPNGTLAANGTVDQTLAKNWLQANSWTVLPDNVFFDTNFSAMNGTMTINFNGTTAPGYGYYQFSANGQAQLTPLVRVAPASSTTVTSSLAQFVVSPGRLDSSGNFVEKNAGNAKSFCYGFVLFPMGNMSFFQDVSTIQQPS